MSGYDAGALFVRIVPTAEGFGQTAAAEIKRQAPAIQQAASQAVGSSASSAEIAKLRNQAKGLADGFVQAGKSIDQSLFSNLQTRSAALSEELGKLTAKGGNVLGVVSADFERMFAAEQKASAQLLDYNANLGKTAVAEELAAKGARDRGTAQAQTARSQLRNVLTGRAGIGSLGPAELGRFALGGLAVGAVFQGLQHLSEGLRVTGEEAATTEGKLRNFGASLVTGDIVGGVLALTKQADSASESLRKLLATEGTSTVELRNFASETTKAAQAQQRVADTSAQSGNAVQGFARGTVTAGAAAAKTAIELRDAADEATHLARAFDASAQAAADVESAIQAAGSSAAQFGEQARGTGGVEAGNRRAGAGAQFTDASNTAENQNAIAQSIADRTQSLQDNLAQAKKEAAAAALFEKNNREVVEDRLKNHRATVEANTRAVQIEQQIDAQVSQRAKESAAERQRAAADAKRAREEAARDAAEEARAAAAAAKAEIDRRLALDDLRIEQAGLTKGLGDDRKAINAKIDDLKALRAKTKQYSQEWINYSRDITDLRLTLQNLGSSKKSAAAQEATSSQDIFAAAAAQFNTFGSNISRRNGVLSGQDERAAFAQNLQNDIGGHPLLSETQRTNQILSEILSKIGSPEVGGSPALGDKGSKGNLLAIYGSEIAAAYGYGVN